VSSVSIRQRTISSGEERFDVRYRRGGRYFPVEHGGTFHTREEADLRVESVRRDLARALPRRRLKARGKVYRPEFVYFARLGDLIKIGISQEPGTRAQTLNAELLGAIWGDRDLEAQLHEEFHDLRVGGEWFRAEPRLLERIEAFA